MMTLILLAMSTLPFVRSLDNGLGLTPAMGYNTWNDLGKKLNEQTLRTRADAMVDSGLRDAGYIYFNLDDGWQSSERNATTQRLHANPELFPSGMPALVSYVHSKGLLFGIYTDRGSLTCAKKPGSLGFEKIDAQTYAEWGVDYVKEDNCNAPNGPNDRDTALAEFGLFRDALNATGRAIYFSVCGGGDELPWSNITWFAKPPFGKNLANSWRIAPDCVEWLTTVRALSMVQGLERYSGPGGWNDPDMLLVSTTTATRKLSEAQSRAQFSLWSILSAPLLIGGPIASLSAWDLETYLNKEVIAIDQDPLAEQGALLVDGVYGRRLYDGSIAVVFVNENHPLSTTLTCGADCWSKTPFSPSTVLSVYDLWTHGPANVSTITVPEPYSVSLPARGHSAMFKFSIQ